MARLAVYRAKRDFATSPEPAGATRRPALRRAASFVVHKHRASSLHYDFRLEWSGALLSWAIPKGPSLDPAAKRLARLVEDHPLEYADFEGVIPAGQYGGGTVMVWDRGTWHPASADVAAMLRAGKLEFTLQGEKLRGAWALVRMRNPTAGDWLLVKMRDRFASKTDVTVAAPCSVRTGRSLVQIARAGGGDVDRAADADPPSAWRCGETRSARSPRSRVARSRSAS